MTEFRLHIDIPLGNEEAGAIYISNLLLQEFFKLNHSSCSNIIGEKYGIQKINYRLGHDEDRQRFNYLDKNKNGHVSNRKLTIDLISG